MSRALLQSARRIVVKVGTSSVTSSGGRLDPARIDVLCAELAAIRAKDRQLVLVSSGAIAAGLKPLGLSGRPADMPSLQAAASVGQSVLMHAYQSCLHSRGYVCGQVLITMADLWHRATYLNARQTLLRLLDLGAVPIVNENDTVATDEIRRGENDGLAARVAHLVHADVLVLLSDVDGLHDGGAGGPLLAEVDKITPAVEAMAGPAASDMSSGGMRTKIEAAKIATGAGVTTIIARARRGVLEKVIAGETVGTYFAPQARLRSRKAWIAHASYPQGLLVVDEGAVRALLEGKRSLLAAGVRSVEGTFAAGDSVDIAGPDRAVFARGLVGFASAELREIAGRSRAQREVVHRDQLVLLQ